MSSASSALASVLLVVSACVADAKGGGGGGGGVGGGGHGNGNGDSGMPAWVFVVFILVFAGCIGGTFGYNYLRKKRMEKEIQELTNTRKTRVGADLCGKLPPPSGMYVGPSTQSGVPVSTYQLTFQPDGTFFGNGSDKDGQFQVVGGVANMRTGVLSWTEQSWTSLTVACESAPKPVSHMSSGQPTTDGRGGFETGVVNWTASTGRRGQLVSLRWTPSQAGVPAAIPMVQGGQPMVQMGNATMA